MAGFIIYDSVSGTPTKRPVHGWGICPDGLEDQQASLPDHVSVAAGAIDVADLLDYAFNTFDPATGEIFTSEAGAAATGATEEYVEREIRYLLRASDWTQLADSPLDSGAQTAWDAFRSMPPPIMTARCGICSSCNRTRISTRSCRCLAG